jgi:hypothetical protein
MAQSNFQDVVQLNQDTLSVLGEQLVLGSSAGSKSIVFAQDPTLASALHLAASNPTAARTVILQDANGTVGLITAISANAAGIANGAVVFSNANNVTFGLAGSTITASASAASATVVSAIGVSTGGNTIGNTGTTNGTIVFAGIGNVTLSQATAPGNNATITISGSQSTAIAGIAAGSQTATSGTVIFSNSNGFTFGMNGSLTITATYERRITAFSQWAEFATNFSISNASLSLQKVSMPMHLSVTGAIVPLALSGSSNSSGALTISMAIYTLNGVTASLASSGSRQISWTSGSDTSASSRYGGASGTRYRTFGINASLTPGDYLVGFWFRTTNDGTWRVFGRNGMNLVGTYDGIETSYFLDGFSTSSFTTAMPGSVVATNTNYVRTSLQALQQPGVILLGSF